MVPCNHLNRAADSEREQLSLATPFSSITTAGKAAESKDATLDAKETPKLTKSIAIGSSHSQINQFIDREGSAKPGDDTSERVESEYRPSPATPLRKTSDSNTSMVRDHRVRDHSDCLYTLSKQSPTDWSVAVQPTDSMDVPISITEESGQTSF